MYKFSSFVLLLVAILCGCAFANAEQVAATSTVQLHMFGSSSRWWIAVQPRNDNGLTSKVELKDAASSSFTTLTQSNTEWGYWSVTAPREFIAPLTFRLTSSSGNTITVQVNSIVPDAVINTGAAFGGSSPTTKATSAPTAKATSAPTAKATSAPTAKATSAPTAKATSAPTAKATSAPTAKATSAPTTKPSTAPTTKPATSPTTRPTTAPTTRPTTAPSTGSSSNLCALTSVSSEPLKIMVPLYVYPGADWDSLIAAASKVKILAIINPNSGPASSVDSTYSSYMTKLKNAGIEMVGYVYTSYGTRDVSAVQADIDTYASKYPLITGIFLDEAANDASKISFYTQVYNYIMAKPGYQHTILNPGVQPDEGYLAISTNIMIYENYASSVASTSLSSWVTCAPSAAQKSDYKYKFSGIAHTAAAASQASYVTALANKGIGYVYVTDGVGGCCTYNTLTSYFAQLASAVAAYNGN